MDHNDINRTDINRTDINRTDINLGERGQPGPGALDGPLLPPWARPMRTLGRAQQLLKVATTVITHRYEAPLVDGWQGSLSVPGGPVFGLTTLAEVAADTPRKEWQLLAYDMFSALDFMDGQAMDAMLSDWDEVRDHLRIRIFGGRSDDRPFPVVSKPLGPTSYIGLGVELDRIMASVSDVHAGRWPLPLSEVWATAAANRDEKVPVTYEIREFDGCAFAAVDGDGLAVTGHALDLTLAIPELSCPPDVAVMAPSAHTLLVLPQGLDCPEHGAQLRRTFHRAGVRWAEICGNRVSFDVFRYRGPGRLTYEAGWSASTYDRRVLN